LDAGAMTHGARDFIEVTRHRGFMASGNVDEFSPRRDARPVR
jgi:hypothetical protein